MRLPAFVIGLLPLVDSCDGQLYASLMDWPGNTISKTDLDGNDAMMTTAATSLESLVSSMFNVNELSGKSDIYCNLDGGVLRVTFTVTDNEIEGKGLESSNPTVLDVQPENTSILGSGCWIKCVGSLDSYSKKETGKQTYTCVPGLTQLETSFTESDSDLSYEQDTRINGSEQDQSHCTTDMSDAKAATMIPKNGINDLHKNWVSVANNYINCQRYVSNTYTAKGSFTLCGTGSWSGKYCAMTICLPSEGTTIQQEITAKQTLSDANRKEIAKAYDEATNLSVTVVTTGSKNYVQANLNSSPSLAATMTTAAQNSEKICASVQGGCSISQKLNYVGGGRINGPSPGPSPDGKVSSNAAQSMVILSLLCTILHSLV
jgi:hypothetical protein